MKKFRFHILGVPHTRTNLDYIACAYTQKIYKFCKMMHQRGHYIIHYGVEGSNPICDENVVVVSNEIYNKVYGDHDYHSKWFKFDLEDECYQTFFRNTIQEIEKRKQPLDIILPFWGTGVQPICDAFPDLITIEPGIGYSYTFANYRIFESYAIYHAMGGQDSMSYCHQSNYDTIIPNYFDENDFEYNGSKERRLNSDDPYFLFVGRVYDGKGLNIAIQVCEVLGAKLKVAGQLDESYEGYQWPANVEFIGYADVETRKNLMKNAIASFVASQYVEPFGGVQVENLLCGTPTITSDWGAFAENNIQGVTGYRCRTFDDYVRAALDCLDGKINYIDCRKKGEEFLLDNIAPKYEKFFEDVMNLYTAQGWYTLKDDTKARLEKLGRKENNE